MIRSLNQKGNAVLWIIFAVVIVGIIIMAARLGSPQVEPIPVEDLEALQQIQEDDNIIGDRENTDLVLIEYSDFECPACASYAPIVKEIISEYGDQLTFAYRHFPLRTIHPNAQRAAQAAEAAGNQDMFFEFHDLLFERQSDWRGRTGTQRFFEEYAEEIGLDVDQFKSDLRDRDVIQRVNNDFAEAVALGVDSTPTFFLNGSQISPGSLDEFKAIIDAELAGEGEETEEDTVKLDNGISVEVGASNTDTE